MSDPQLPTPEQPPSVDEGWGTPESSVRGVIALFGYVERIRRRIYEILIGISIRLRSLESGMGIPKPLTKSTELTTSLVTMYEVPAIETPRKLYVEVVTITACNYSASDADITAHVIASGGSAANSNLFLDAVPCKAGETTIIHAAGSLVNIESGDFIQMKASANSAIVVTISGPERGQ